MNIHNRILEIADNYHYDRYVFKTVEEYKRALEDKKLSYVINLKVNFQEKYVGDNEEIVAQNIADDVIKYKIREKTLVKLMAEGLILPIRTNKGWESHSIKCVIEGVELMTHLEFRRLVFDEFMKV